MGTGGVGTTLIGRGHELDQLRRALTTAAGGHGQVVLIEGEAGIGKSRLVRAVASAAADEGFDVHEGFCDDIASARPFTPIARALRISETSGDADRRIVAAMLAGDSDDAAALTVSSKQFRVIELLGALVEKLAEARPLVLVVEDLHWADRATLAALRSVAQRIALLPVIVVATMRPGYEREELQRALDGLLRDGASRIVLDALSSEEVAVLAAEVLGDTPSDELLARLAGAAGNPLFVCEFVDALADSTEPDAVPIEFRQAVLRRLGQLSEATNELLRVASVLGATFSAAELATALGTTSRELSSRLQQAMQSGVVGERDDRLAFRHDLVRDAVYEHIPIDLRRQLHREVGDALAGAGADPLVVAHHLALAAASYDEQAAAWLRRAARDVRLRAPGVAVALLERAVALLPPSFGERDEYLADLVLPLAWAGRFAEAESLGRDVLQRRPPPDLAGELRCGLVYALTWQGRSADALAYTELAEGESLTPEDAVLLEAEAALAHLFSFNFPAAAPKAAAAEAGARALDHDLALCYALCAKSWVLQFGGRFADAVETCREAIEIADRSENGEGHLAHPRFFPGISLINQDRLDEAQAVLQRGRQISEELGLFTGLPMYHSHLGGERFISGDWDAAVAELETSLRLADEIGTNILVTTAAAAWLTVIHVRRDELEPAERLVRRQLQRQGVDVVGFGLLSWAQAILAEAKGDLDGAVEFLAHGFEAFFRAGANSSDPWTAMAYTRLLLKHGDRARAAEVVGVVESRQIDPSIASSAALPLRCRGLLEGDADTLMHALQLYRASGRRVDVADTAADVGLCLVDNGRVEDAAGYLDDAIEIYEDIGATRDVAYVRAELRARGVARGARGRRSRGSTGWESLTDTELKVVALVAQRMSNPEVAERLFVSRHTVESHLKNIYRKLGIGSRGELAAAAAAQSSLA